MRLIQSVENPLIKEIKKIKEKPKERVFIEGANLIKAAFNSKSSLIEKILVTEDFIQKNTEFFELIGNFPSLLITDKVAKAISDTVSCQGIFAIAKFKLIDIKDLSLTEPNLIVVADRIQDPGNLGTIIRVAEAFGVQAIFITPGTCNPLSPKVIRASAGSIFFIPVVKAKVEEIESFLSKNRLQLIVTDPQAERVCFEIDSRQPLALAFGNEARGVGEELRRIPHVSFRIPHLGRTESLNVAQSAAIFLYEILRGRLK